MADASEPSIRLTPAVTPHGNLHLVPAEEGAGLDDVRSDLRPAFHRGNGEALLELALSRTTPTESASLCFLRELGRLFLVRLCGVPELESLRERVDLDAPKEALAKLAQGVPPMPGAEYVAQPLLERWWTEIQEAFRARIANVKTTVQAWLAEHDPTLNLLGRVVFSLAERKDDSERPFAFLATYTVGADAAGRAKHRQLGELVRASAETKDRTALLAILVPLQRAAERSAWVKERQEDHRLFRPMAWTPSEARAFLVELPIMEAAGIIVRVPDWWKSRKPPSPSVTVTIGDQDTTQVGAEAMVDFRVEVTLGDEVLSAAMLKKLLASEQDWVRIKGQWVDLDRARLAQVLDHWKRVERTRGSEGLSFLEGMRLLAGVSPGGGVALTHEPGNPSAEAGAEVKAGRWLSTTLRGLRDPAYRRDLRSPRGLEATLRPYQADGVSWLDFVLSLGLGACLADDMGLGKTVQVIALLLHAKSQKTLAPSLLLVPASLIGNWQAELDRFAPSLRVFIAHASAAPADQWSDLAASDLEPYDVVIATHAAPWRLPWLAKLRWRFLVVDEAQAIKNPGAKQTLAVKALKAGRRIALTGTPIENRLGDLWSIFDFLTPGLLGSASQFAAYLQSLRRSASSDYSALRRLVHPSILRRMKTDPDVVPDLPAKTEMQAFCSLTKKQAALYARSVDELRGILATVTGIQRRGLVLAFLMRFKQICNHPSQWLGDHGYDPDESGKFDRLREICEPIVGRQEKALIFTQFRELTDPLAEFLSKTFGRPPLVLHGGTPVGARRKLVERFQHDDDHSFFVLSIKAGGTGLNLTAASHVVHFDRWWNPAVEDQATDRAFRIGQRRNVLVHKFVCRGTIEEKIDRLIRDKRALSRDVLSAGTEASITELSDREVLELVTLDLNRALSGG